MMRDKEITASLVRSAFRRLKPKHQELLLMLQVDDMSYEEVASIRGVSLNRVEKDVVRMLIAWCDAVDEVRAGYRERALTKIKRRLLRWIWW